MSASLVGSEMCIRDRLHPGVAPADLTAVGRVAPADCPVPTLGPEEARLEPRGVTELTERLGGGGGKTSLERLSAAWPSSCLGCVHRPLVSEGVAAAMSSGWW
eukprot:5963683-Alexandrium_andersonii.AAC.1